MFSVEVAHQCILGRRSMATLFTDVQLAAALLVSVLLRDTVDLLHVGLQRAALGEGLLTETALVWTNTCVCADMPLEIEGVVEALSAKVAQVPLLLAVTFQVSV